MTPFLEEQGPFVFSALPYVLGLVALAFPLMWPAALLACIVFDQSPIIVLVLLMALNFDHRGEEELKEFANKERRYWIQAMVLAGLVLTYPFEASYPLESKIALALIPFFAYKPMAKWLRGNSGGSWFMTPFLCLGWLSVMNPISMGEAEKVMSLVLIVFMLLMAMYRQIPKVIRFLLLVSASFAGLWVLQEDSRLFVVFSCYLVSVVWDKWLWGQKFCALQLGAWSQMALLILAMLLSTGREHSVLHACFGLALLFAANQELCRLCIAGAKCREVTLSWWVVKLPLLYLTLCVLGYKAGVGVLFMLGLSVLAQEVSRNVRLRPLQLDDLSDSTCRDDFVESSLHRGVQ